MRFVPKHRHHGTIRESLLMDSLNYRPVSLYIAVNKWVQAFSSDSASILFRKPLRLVVPSWTMSTMRESALMPAKLSRYWGTTTPSWADGPGMFARRTVRIHNHTTSDRVLRV